MNIEVDQQTLFKTIYVAILSNNTNTDIVDSCIEDGFDIETIDYFYQDSLLAYAVRRQNTVFAKKFLSVGANPNTESCNVPLLHLAISNHDEGMTRILIEAKADIDTVDCHGVTVLMLATLKEMYSLCRYLIDCRANLNKRSRIGNTAIHCAVSRKLEPFVRMFLEAGADPNILDVYDTSPLDYAANSNYFEIALLLLNAGAHVTKPRHLTDLLCCAVGAGKYELVSALIPRVHDVNTMYSVFYVTPLMIAASLGCTKMMVLLINAGAVVDKETEAKAVTALRYAIVGNQIDATILLIACGANVNKTTKYVHRKETLLMLAANHGYETIVKILLAKGAKAHHRTTDGRTAYNVAIKNGHHEIAEMINTSSDILGTMIFMRSRIRKFEEEDGLQKNKLK